jgi:hypothetical protein
MSIETFYMNAKNRHGAKELLDHKDPTRLWRIRVDEYDEKTRLQEEKAHAMLADIARQQKHLNRVLDVDSWKRLTVSQFRTDSIQNDVPRVKDYWLRNRVELILSLDGSSLVTLGAQTRDFPKYIYAAWITWLYAFGDNLGIEWSEPQEEFDQRYAA